MTTNLLEQFAQDIPIAGGKKPARSGGSGAFDSAVEFTLRHEGGYVANDAGKGASNFGVNKTANPDVDVEGLTVDGAKSIYKTRYWDAIGGDELAQKSPDLARVAFDTAVNMGAGTASQMVRDSGGDPVKLLKMREERYRNLLAADPKRFGKYANGWMARVNELRSGIDPSAANGQEWDRGAGYADIPSAAPPDRSLGGAINDTMIDTANAAVGLVKSGVDLFAPDSAASESMDEFIKSGKEKQSDKKKWLDRQLQERLKAEGDDEWAKAGIQLGHSFVADPLGTIGQIAGNIGPFAVIGRGLQAAKLANGVRTAISSGIAGGMGAGEVRGNIWERINGMQDADLIAESPAYANLRKSGVSEADAKKELGANFSRNLPEVALAGMLGALSGKYGVEGMAAGVAPKYAAGRLGAAVVGGLDEGVVQGGSEQLASNYGVQRVIPSQSLTQDLGPNIVMEGIPGVAMGGAFGGQVHAKKEPDVAPAPNPLADQLAASGGVLSRAATASNPDLAKAPASEPDPLSTAAADFDTAIREGDLLPQFRAAEEQSPGLTDLVLGALATAKNPNAPESARMDAINTLSGAMDALSQRRIDQVGQQWQDISQADGGMAPAGPSSAWSGMTEEERAAEREAAEQAGAAASRQRDQAVEQAGAEWQNLGVVPETTLSDSGPGTPVNPFSNVADRPPYSNLTDRPGGQPPVQPKPSVAPAVVAEEPEKPRKVVAAPVVDVPPQKAGEPAMPAAVRQRKAQLTAMVNAGFDAIEQRDGRFWLVNHADNYETPLENAADAARAGLAIKTKIDGEALPVSPTIKVSQEAKNDGRGSQAAQNAAGRLADRDPGQEDRQIPGDGGLRSEGAGVLRDAGDLERGNPGATQGPARDLVADRAAVARLRSNRKMAGLAIEDVEDGDPALASLEPIISHFAAKFGKRAIPVRAKGDGAFDGVNVDGKLFINLDEPFMPLVESLVHEFSHTNEVGNQRVEYPGLAALHQRMFDLIPRSAKETYFSYLVDSNQAEARDYSSATAQDMILIRSEMTRDFMGRRFNDKAWLTRLGQEKPHLFGNFVRDWIKLLDDLIEALRGKLNQFGRLGSDRKNIDHLMRGHLKELEEMKAIAMDVAEQWATKAPGMAERLGVTQAVEQGRARMSAQDVGDRVYYRSGNVRSGYMGLTFLAEEKELADKYEAGLMGVPGRRSGVSEHRLTSNKIADMTADAKAREIALKALKSGGEYGWLSGDEPRFARGYFTFFERDSVVEALKAAGYDGMRIAEYPSGDGKTVAVFNPGIIAPANQDIRQNARQPSAAEQAELQAELDAEMGVDTTYRGIEIEEDITDAAIRKAGIHAEDAFPAPKWRSTGDGGYQVSIKGLYGGDRTVRLTIDRAHNGLYETSIEGAWVGPASSEASGYVSLAGAKDFIRRQIAARELRARGYDLVTSLSPGELDAIRAGWDAINAMDDGARKYPLTDENAHSIRELAHQMGLDEGYTITANESLNDPDNKTLDIVFKNKVTGKVESGLVSMTRIGGKWHVSANTIQFAKSGLGTAFYQLAVEHLARRGLQLSPEPTLSGINTYRRTEQMLAAALRNGISNAMVPHPVQRIYGFQNDASTEDEHRANVARMLIANLRNVRELAPQFDRLRYHPETGAFTFKNGRDASGAIDELLTTTDARSLGLGRSTIARALLTQAMLDGRFKAPESFAAPVLYSARDQAEIEYAAVAEKYRDTPQWMRAPNGKPTKLTERQWIQVRTPSFVRWFGPWEKFAGTRAGVWSDGNGEVSKVVDANGEPLVVYHGTSNGGFMAFRRPGGGRRGDLGIFGSDNYDMADSYVRKGRSTDIEARDDKALLEDLEIEFRTEKGRISSREAEDRDVFYYTDSYGQDYGPFESEQDAVNDAWDSFGYQADSSQPGIYAMFVNLRNPNEENFEGAMWNGSRDHQWVVEVGGEIQSDANGRQYFNSKEEAADFAQSFVADDAEGDDADPLSYVRGADEHYTDTDGVAREAISFGNDGAIIREVIDDGGGPGPYAGEPSDVFVAFKPNQLKSADWNTGEFGLSDDLRFSVKDQPVGESVDEVVAYRSVNALARGSRWRKGRDLKMALQTLAMSAARRAGVNIKADTENIDQYLVRVGLKDALFALKQNPNAVGWYDKKTAQALAISALVHPELATDENARFAFTWALAVTSNGMRVDANFALADKVYETYKKRGVMPTNIRAGTAQGQINYGLKTFNQLVSRWGIDNLRKFSQSNFTVGEIGRIDPDLKPGGEHVDVHVRGAAIIGPKIGNGFFSNLYGHFDALTIDRWLIRTWGRWTATLLVKNPKGVEAARDRLVDAMSLISLNTPERIHLSKIIGRTISFESNPDEIASAVAKASMDPDARAGMNETWAGVQLRLAGNSLAKYLDQQKEAPEGPTERKRIRKVFRSILAELHKTPEYHNLNMADLQAALWYAEKRLYETAKEDFAVGSDVDEEGQEVVGYENDEAPDYANAAAKLAMQKRVKPELIRAVLDNDKPARLPGAGGFTPDEQAKWAKQVSEQRTLEMEKIEPKMARVIFEVAPHPGTLAARAWNQLSPEYRSAVSDRIVDLVVSGVLKHHGQSGSILLRQTGSYQDDTNTSYALLLKNSKLALQITNEIGYVLSQKEMVAIMAKKIDGAEETGAVVIDVGDIPPAQVDAIYQKLRELEKDGEKIVGGQSTINGQMVVLNYSGIPLRQYSRLLFNQLGKKYNVQEHAVFSAFPSFEDYSYGNLQNGNQKRNRGAVRQWLDSLRGEAADVLRTELSLGDTEVRFSSRDPAGDRPGDRGRPLDAATIRSAIHFGRQGGLSILSGASNGSGIRGAEDERVRQATDPRIKRRVYFYSPVQGGIPNPEAGLGGNVYQADIEGLYDPRTANAPVRGQGTAFESAVLDAGYSGYVDPESGVMVVLNSDVPVKHIGSIGDFKVVQRVATPFKPKTATRTEGDELVRRPEPSELGSVIRNRDEIKAVAPSFRMVYGEARILAGEAPAADEVLANAGSPFRFGEVRMNSRDQLEQYLDARNRKLPTVSPASALEDDIATATVALQRVVAAIKADRFESAAVPLGPVPHTLSMLGAPTQMMKIDTSIVRKVLVDKHSEHFKDITPREFVMGIYRPAMVLNGDRPMEVEIVSDILTDEGPIMFALKSDVKTSPASPRVTAVMSAYPKPIAGGGNTIAKRILSGKLIYADMLTAQQAITGQKVKSQSQWTGFENSEVLSKGSKNSGPDSTALPQAATSASSVVEQKRLVKPFNEKYAGWQLVKAKILGGIADKKVKTDVDLVRWIAARYKGDIKDVPSFSARSPIGFYSELSEQIEKSTMRQAPAAAWKTFIKALSQKGVKPDEVEWTGVNEWLDLQDGKVTKDAVLDYLGANGVQVQETVLGESKSGADEWEVQRNGPEDYDVIDGNGEVVEAGFLARSTAQEFIDDEQKKGGTKYRQYNLPGGQNYREVLLTLPVKSAAPTEDMVAMAIFGLPYRNLFPGQQEDVRRNLTSGRFKPATDGAYISGHWAEPNVLAHIRVNDRTDADGKRVLFVEEIQSDFGQEGNEKGFVGQKPEDEALLASLQSKQAVAPDDATARRISNLQKRIARNDYSIPKAPFVDSTDKWLALALKRIIKMAVDGGYDKVAFVNGEQSADRYKLSHEVDSIGWRKNGPGPDKIVVIKTVSGSSFTLFANAEGVVGRIDARSPELNSMSGKTLSEIVGKDFAGKIAGEDSGEASGDGLDIGGSGMKTFYDQIVPNATRALLKKLGGGQMETVGMAGRNQGGISGDDAMRAAGIPGSERQAYWLALSQEERDGMIERARDIKLEQPGFSITPALREKASAGLPLFSARDIAAAEAAGFDTSKVWYHGTAAKANFRAMKAGKGGFDELGRGIYFTDRPDYAGAWAGKPGQGGRIIPAFIRRGDIYDLAKPVDSLVLAKRIIKRNPPTDIERQAKQIRDSKSVTEWTEDEARIVNQADAEGLWRSWLLEPPGELANHIKFGDRNTWLARAGYVGARNENSQIPGQIVVFKSEDVRVPWAKFNPRHAGKADLLLSARDAEDTPAFKAWSGELPVVGEGEYEGGPAVFRAYHATTHSNITTFKRQGSKEGFLGQGPYFTTSPEDASANYAGVGPDLAARIENLAEQYQPDDWSSMREYLDDYFGAYDTLTPGAWAERYDDKDYIDVVWDEFGSAALRHAAVMELKGDSDGLVMPSYVKLQNPADATGKQMLTYNVETNEDGDVEDETGSLVDWVLKAREIGEQYGIASSDIEKHIDDILQDAGDGEVSMQRVFDSARHRLLDGYDGDDYVSAGEVFSAIAQELGYDGIIMDAGLHFGQNRRGFAGVRIGGMKGVGDDTLHIVPFSSNQVKSAIGNNGQFSLVDDDIRASSRDASWADDRIKRLMSKYAYTMDDNRTKAYAGWVRPDEFLAATTPASYRGKLESEAEPLNTAELAKQVQEIMLISRDHPTGGTFKTEGHEGRHRMVALRKAGVERVPVIFSIPTKNDAKPLDSVRVTPQKWSGGPNAEAGFAVDRLIPVSWANFDKLKAEFGGEGRVRFSAREAAETIRAYARDHADVLFRTPKTDAKDMATIAKAIGSDYGIGEPFDGSGTDPRWDKSWVFDVSGVQDGVRVSAPVFISQKGDAVWVNVGSLSPGMAGGVIYQIAGAYAHNNGKVLIGDPDGITEAGRLRRLENMISLALKYGTTEFMRPHGSMLGWNGLQWSNNPDNNLLFMLRSSLMATSEKVPEVKEISYDPRTGKFTRNGADFTRADFKDLAERSAKSAKPSDRDGMPGSGTLRLASIFQSLQKSGDFDGAWAEPGLRGGDGGSSGVRDAVKGLRWSARDDYPLRESSREIVGSNGRQYTKAQLDAFARVGFEVETPSLKERAKALWQDAGKKLAQGLFDQFAPVRELNQEAYGLLRLAKGSAGAFETLLKGGKLKLTDGVYDFDDGNRGGVIDRLLKPMQGEHHDFLRWVAANRAEGLMAEGRENLFTPEDIAAIKTLADGKLKFDYTLQHGANAGQTTRSRAAMYADSLLTFNEFNRNVLDMASQSGLIDEESRHLWEGEFYVPFYRVSDEDGLQGANIKGGVVRQKAFQKLKGGKDVLNADLMDNTLMNWAHLLDAAAKNRAAKATLEAAEVAGAAIPASEEIARQIGKATGNRHGVVWFMDQGLQRFYLVEDPYIMSAITSLEYAGMRNPVMNAMSTVKHYLTVGVTASPFFKVRNLIRDSIQAVAASELGYNPLGNLAQGWSGTNQKSDLYFRLLAGGGTIHFGTMLEGSEARRVQALVERGVNPDNILDNHNKLVSFHKRRIEPLIEAYNELGNRGETINRAALYKQLIAQGKSHAEASLMARDLMDFSMQGNFATIRFLTQVVPFLNARLQGLNKLGKAARENPQRMALVTGAVAMASLALLALYGDDDDWKKREDWDRDNFWWFKLGGIAFRVPKPFEVGAIGTLAERSAELIFSDEMTGDRFRSRVLALLGDNLSMNPIPQLVKPMLDVYANKDSFSGRPIETMSMERLQSQYRFTSSTSMTARGASTALNAVTGLVGKESLSPVQIDSLIRGYFGWLGTFVVGGVDVAARYATNQPTRPTMDYWKTATGSMVSQLDDAQSRYVSHVYDQARAIEEAYGTWRALQKEGKTEEAADFRAANDDKIKGYRNVEAIKGAISKINQRIREIERSDMDRDAKRDEIRRLNQRKDEFSRRLAA